MKALTIILISLLATVSAMAAPEAPDSALRASLRKLECRADSGNPKAIFDLSNVYEQGYGPVAADSARSVELLRKAAGLGYAPAQNYLGYKLFNGYGMERDRKRGLDLIEEAAMKGDPKAEANLGWLLVSGEEVEPDPEKAVYWLGKAAGAGLPMAMLQLGAVYAEGLPPVAPDTLKAVALYLDASRAGVPEGDIRLEKLMAPAWAQLPADSALSLGLTYYLDDNAPVSAAALFSVAAAKSDARACALLGECYALGRGKPYDYSLAIQSFYRAADMGYAPAQYILAELLDIFPDALTDIIDSGVNRNQEANVNAVYWYEQAAEAGISNSEEALSRLWQAPPSAPE